jgi:hypothetical protein
MARVSRLDITDARSFLSMVTSNALQRTFLIRSGQSTGTGFTIDLDSGHYLLTAKQVLENATESIEIFQNGEWRGFEVEPTTVSEPDVDAIALRLSVRIWPNHPLEPSNSFYVSTADVFARFPFRLIHGCLSSHNGFPIAFVKSATCAGLGGTVAARVMFLDGINNPGFSGGPIVYTDYGTNRLKLAGIVSAYRFNETRIWIHDAQTQNYVETTLVARENTGIIVGYGIDPVIKAITNAR